MFKLWTHDRTEERCIPKATEPAYVDIVGENFYDRCRVRDISINGVSIYIRHDFVGCKIDTEIDIHLTLPSKKSFKAVGRIRHIGTGVNHYFGIQLISMEENGHKILAEYVKSLSNY